MPRASRREEMRSLLALRERRGLTYRELAQETGIASHTLSWWAWKLRQEAKQTPAFVEVDIEPELAAPMIEIELAGGDRLRVPVDIDGEALHRVIAALREC